MICSCFILTFLHISWCTITFLHKQSFSRNIILGKTWKTIHKRNFKSLATCWILMATQKDSSVFVSLVTSFYSLHHKYINSLCLLCSESNFISRYFSPTKQTSLVLHQPPNNIWCYRHGQKNRHRNWRRCCFSPVSLSDVIPIQTLPTQSRGSAEHPLSPWLQLCICHTLLRRTTPRTTRRHTSRHWSVCHADRHFVQWERKWVMSLRGWDWSRDVYPKAECQRSPADAPT